MSGAKAEKYRKVVTSTQLFEKRQQITARDSTETDGKINIFLPNMFMNVHVKRAQSTNPVLERFQVDSSTCLWAKLLRRQLHNIVFLPKLSLFTTTHKRIKLYYIKLPLPPIVWKQNRWNPWATGDAILCWWLWQLSRSFILYVLIWALSLFLFSFKYIFWKKRRDK